MNIGKNPDPMDIIFQETKKEKIAPDILKQIDDDKGKKIKL